ncbi:nitrile hydratase accessory protein [Salinarimonas soli]|uniref:Nitrile hydratase accessory protein n=1 Tax=Salinarimonas soli TaxID=1638099 RepID=A0A5B2VDT1_9HYPH|nr:nitrile hydratase accessory protein [Salinarimonas soli]KAA2236519.1 nitrile hydratase accessory protein [Salinarimonas soli]
MSRPERDLLAAAAAVAPAPVCGDAPVFGAPWEAQAFAMTLALHERGLFTWPEWAAALSAAIRAAQAGGDPDDGTTYYAHWLAALERLVAERGIAPEATLHERRAAFDRAARATPHGEPVVLENDPLRRG